MTKIKNEAQEGETVYTGMMFGPDHKKEPEGFSVHQSNNGSSIKFVAGPAFKRMLTNPTLSLDGRTIGDLHIDDLHGYLQSWIVTVFANTD